MLLALLLLVLILMNVHCDLAWCALYHVALYFVFLQLESLYRDSLLVFTAGIQRHEAEPRGSRCLVVRISFVACIQCCGLLLCKRDRHS